MVINLAIFGHGMSLKIFLATWDLNLRRWYQSTGCPIYFFQWYSMTKYCYINYYI